MQGDCCVCRYSNLVCYFKFHADAIFRHIFYYLLKIQKGQKLKHDQKYLSCVLYFMFTVNNLFSCLDLLINSERLLSNIS